MITSEDILFLLIRSEIWQKPLREGLAMDATQYKTIAHLADKQTVTGLVFSAIKTSEVRLGKYDAIDLYKSLERIEAKNKQMDADLAQLAEVLNRHEIAYVVVKGQTLSVLYPHPGYRMAGDIDLYVAAQDMQKLYDTFASEFGLTLPPFGKGKHVSTTFGSTEVEVHSRLNDFASKRHQRAWNELYENAFDSHATVMIGGVPVKTLSATLNVLYVFVHYYYHLLVLGVGLRQLIDLAVCLHAQKPLINAEELAHHLHAIGLYDAFCALGAVMTTKLGLREDDFPFTIEPWHAKYTPLLVDDMMKLGNFGHYNPHMNVSGWRHTMETAKLVYGHAARYFRLSPWELTCLVPTNTWSSFVRNVLKR